MAIPIRIGAIPPSRTHLRLNVSARRTRNTPTPPRTGHVLSRIEECVTQ